MKKTMKLSIIASILSICMVGFVGCGDKPVEGTKTDNDKKPDIIQQIEEEDEKDAEKEDMKEFDPDNEEEQNKVANAVLEVDGKKASFPMTVNQLMEMGFVTDSDTDKVIEAGGIDMGGTTLSYGDTEILINISACNATDAPISLKDCLVTDLATRRPEISVNGIACGTSTYDDVLKLYGKDHSNRNPDLKKDIEEDGTLVNLCYATDEIENYYNDIGADFIRLFYDIKTNEAEPDSFGKVYELKYNFNIMG